jgi:hypothetical protein
MIRCTGVGWKFCSTINLEGNTLCAILIVVLHVEYTSGRKYKKTNTNKERMNGRQKERERKKDTPRGIMQ